MGFFYLLTEHIPAYQVVLSSMQLARLR